MTTRRTLFLHLALSLSVLGTLAAIASTIPTATQTITIACVGDSITQGVGTKTQGGDYPSQLQLLLGKGHRVRNFGNSGSTMLDEGDKPYKKQQSFTDAVAFAADIYVIMLGTNDSKPQNWAKKESFVDSTKSLIAAFQKANPKARIYLCTPVPVIGEGNWGINNPVVHGEIGPIIQKLALELKLPLIDLYTALDNHPEVFPDRVHPNDAGARLIAKAVHAALTKK